MVTVRYVDGEEATAPPADWPRFRSDGVDYVDLHIDDDRGYRIQGQSAYWLYREDGLWVAGGGTVTNVREVVAGSDGFEHRQPSRMPDLPANVVKWGWWEP